MAKAKRKPPAGQSKVHPSKAWFMKATGVDPDTDDDISRARGRASMAITVSTEMAGYGAFAAREFKKALKPWRKAIQGRRQSLPRKLIARPVFDFMHYVDAVEDEADRLIGYLEYLSGGKAPGVSRGKPDYGVRSFVLELDRFADESGRDRFSHREVACLIDLYRDELDAASSNSIEQVRDRVRKLRDRLANGRPEPISWSGEMTSAGVGARVRHGGTKKRK